MRWFGGLFVAFAGVVGAMLTLRGHASAGWTVWIIGGAIGVAFVLIPALRRPMYVGWMYAAFPIGWTVSHVVLAVTYYAVLTPTGLLLRCFGYDSMRRRIDRSAATYWLERDPAPDPQRYFRQF